MSAPFVGYLPFPSLLGRSAELATMQRWVERASAGERQVVFVTGEAGIGKTTLVNTLVEQAAQQRATHVARGQCLEQYGAGEAYLPVLDGFSRLAQRPGGRTNRCVPPTACPAVADRVTSVTVGHRSRGAAAPACWRHARTTAA